MRFRISSLQQRLVLLLLLPVSIVLIAVGMVGFFYVRQILLNQWQETALLKLSRAAHVIDMRLADPIERISLFSMAADSVSRQRVLDRIAGMRGVKKVQIEWTAASDSPSPELFPTANAGGHMMRFDRARIASLSQPVLDADAGRRTVDLHVLLLDRRDVTVGRLLVKIDFDYLVENIANFGWRQSHMACIVDNQGGYLMHTETSMASRKRLGETGDLLETRILEAILDRDTGTVKGPGTPPSMVAGFHRLSRAPWTIVIFAPGSEVLGPILRFQVIFLAGSLALLLLVLVLIRQSTGPIIRSIRHISDAARDVAHGVYGNPVLRRTNDEIGHLIDSYNTMVEGLRERDRIRNTFGLYIDEDIARDLLAHPEQVRPGGVKREVVILMSDIRGFTPLAESLSPEQTIRALNHYFHYMIRVIKAHRGIIVDFVGDAILVFFDPLDGPVEKTAQRALRCAQAMQQEMVAFNKRMGEERLPALTMGIGLHAGHVVVGNIGSENRVKYGIVGAAVNLTQRIQEKAGGGEILVSEALYRYAGAAAKSAGAADLQMKGFRTSLRLHAIVSPDPESGAGGRVSGMAFAYQDRLL